MSDYTLNYKNSAPSPSNYDAYQQSRSAKLWTRRKESTFFSRLLDNLKRWFAYRFGDDRNGPTKSDLRAMLAKAFHANRITEI